MPVRDEGEGGGAPFNTGHGWLVEAVPAAARRFLVHDSAIRTTLESAGGCLGGVAPDVEVGPLGSPLGAAPVSIVVRSKRPRDFGTYIGRVLGRLSQWVALRLWLLRARRAVKSAGYTHSTVLFFDVEQYVRSESGEAPPARLAERLPRDGVLIAHRAPPERTALDQVLEDVAASLGRPLGRVQPSLRAGVLLIETDREFLRIGIGAAAQQVHDQASVLNELNGRSLSNPLRARIPRILAKGRTGFADWTVETKLPGEPGAPVLTDEVVEDAVTFLIDLAGPLTNDPGPWLRMDDFVPVAALIGGAAATKMLEIAELTVERVADVPRVFGHGDFCSNNLLVERGRLGGVIDWEGAGPGRLPLLDLYHLLLLQNCQPNVYQWGRAIASCLVPMSRSADDPSLRRYLSALGLELPASALQDLVCAYWLSRVGYQVSSFAMRAEDRKWIQSNVAVPASFLSDLLQE